MVVVFDQDADGYFRPKTMREGFETEKQALAFAKSDEAKQMVPPYTGDAMGIVNGLPPGARGLED